MLFSLVSGSLHSYCFFFFFNDTATTEIYTLSLHDALPIYGDGSQTRSFCYVDDMIDAFIKFMSTPDRAVGPLNLGNPVEHSILEIASTIIEMTNSRSEVVFEKLPADDPRQRKPDIAQAKRLLDWSPSTSLRDGLGKTIAYFEAELKKAG